MFANEVRLNHIKLLYLYLLKYKVFSVWDVQQVGYSYVVKLARLGKDNEWFPVHDLTFTLSPIPEGDDNATSIS